MTNLITYTHTNNPNGTHVGYAEQAEIALAKLPEEFQAFVRTQAYDRGHSAGEDEVNMIMVDLASDVQAALGAYLLRVNKR